MISIDELITAIEWSTSRLDVVVSTNDASSNYQSTEEITFVDAKSLLEILNKLKETNAST
jgi:hypothetical protein